MCGIAGWYAWGSQRPDVNTIKGLLLANMERGTSATGMAWQEDDSIICRKGQGPASTFIENTPDSMFAIAAASPRGLLHARATTKGSEKVNVNNHPVVGLEWLVTHNGTIANDDDLWGYYTAKAGVERFAEVDTSVVPLMLSRGTSIEDSIQKLTALSGSATIAAWSEANPKNLLLGRFGHNDLHMFYNMSKDILYWSSAPSAGFVMNGLLMGRHKFLTMSRLADQHVLLLSPEGMSATRVFKLKQRPFFAARKQPAVKSARDSAGVLTNRNGSKSTQVTYEESLSRGYPPTPPKEKTGSSSGLPGTLASDGWRALFRTDRQSRMDAEAGRIRVVFETPAVASARMVAAVWSSPTVDHTKPRPMSDVFSRTWWTLDDILRQFKTDTIVTEVTKESAYGRWTVGVKNLEPYMEFRGHKRTKDWWRKVYSDKFQFPQEVLSDGSTILDDHLMWEHYDIQLQKNDGSTHSFLGFMCPWCGVWMTSTRVQNIKFRCEWCCIHSRVQE